MLIKSGILADTLKGMTDDAIAKKFGVSKSFLQRERVYGSLPKRKEVMGFRILHALSQIFVEVEKTGEGLTHLDYIAKVLNQHKVLSPTLNKWTSDRVKRYLKKIGVPSSGNRVLVRDLGTIQPKSLDEIAEFHVFFLDESFHIPNISVETKQVPTGLENTPTDPYKEELRKGIRKAIKKGAARVSEVTEYLNNKGFKNKSGQPLGRWSVKMYMQEFGLECLEQVSSLDFKDLILDWVKTYPLDQKLSQKEVFQKLEEYITEGQLLTHKIELYKEICGEVTEHNRHQKDITRGEKYREKVEFAVFEKFKHKPITAEEIGVELGLSPMQANRIMRKYLGIEPFDIWFENLYKLVLSFIGDKTEFSIEELSEYLEQSYISTQRGRSWDIPTTNLTYKKLQERYPDLPNSVGRRT